MLCAHSQNISPDQKKTALAKPPTLLETLAYAYFYSGALAGPQVRLLVEPSRLLLVVRLWRATVSTSKFQFSENLYESIEDPIKSKCIK